ncbi:replication initiation protein RepM (plasmid) [Moraxella bovoculi]|uniref:replication initiation protein RepM n=1 Tax=Moraxella bovoculi TaxID=386891 RepID=UPI003F4FCC26
MAKNLVVKDNALINASYNLELVEQRLILLAIVGARASGKGITPNDQLTITASSYMNHFNTNRNASYKALKEACNNLFERQFSYIETNAKGNTEVVRSRWVSEIRYIDNEASVRLIFSPTVAPLITLLEKNFTSYELEQVAELNSKYAVRLYEIVIAWRSTSKTPMIAIDELRGRLGVLDDEYVATADFKRWALDKPIKQINDKTDITITYEQHKQGRKIVGFTFAIKTKSQAIKNTKDSDSRDTNTFDMLAPISMTDKQRQLFAGKLAELSELGGYAPTGASYQEYAKKIEKELLDPEKAEFYRPYLKQVGFSEKK